MRQIPAPLSGDGCFQPEYRNPDSPQERRRTHLDALVSVQSNLVPAGFIDGDRAEILAFVGPEAYCRWKRWHEDEPHPNNDRTALDFTGQ